MFDSIANEVPELRQPLLAVAGAFPQALFWPLQLATINDSDSNNTNNANDGNHNDSNDDNNDN